MKFRKPVDHTSLFPSEETHEVEKVGFCGKMGEVVHAVGGRREGHTRAIILLLLSLMLIFVGTGSMYLKCVCLVALFFDLGADINYLFTRKMFNWDESIFTRVSTIITGTILLT